MLSVLQLRRRIIIHATLLDLPVICRPILVFTLYSETYIGQGCPRRSLDFRKDLYLDTLLSF